MRCVLLSAFRVSLHDTSLHLPVVSQHPAELGLIQQADGADGTEELVQDVPAAANFIDQRWHINRRGFLDGIAVDALPDEPLMGASPAAVLVIETGELLVRRTDDDLVARLKRWHPRICRSCWTRQPAGSKSVPLFQPVRSKTRETI